MASKPISSPDSPHKNGGCLVGVRVPGPLLEKIDNYIEQGGGIGTRPSAIRKLAEIGLERTPRRRP
jgi:hypothetical protein